MLMGRAKQTLFGKRAYSWPTLEGLVESKNLLFTDLAYAKHYAQTEKDAAPYCALLYLARKGHLCLDDDSFQELPIPLQKLIGPIDRPLYLPKYEEIEIQIASHLKRLLTSEENKLSIITGGPGTGKTYTATKIVEDFQSKGREKIIIAAPTGKAASHLEAKLKNIKASTLHSLLKIRTPLDYLKPIEPIRADLLIVDECSMIDPPLFARLLASIDSTTILMGDAHQLSAVEGGSLFADLIASQKIPTTTLTKCWRSDRTEIQSLAQSILSGDAGDIRTIDLGFAQNDLDTIYRKLWQYAKKHFPKDFSKNIDAFRILTILRKGPLGSDALNTYLFEQFSPLTDQFPIMITTNDPKTGLSNGDIGILYKDKEAIFGNKAFPLHQLPSYQYAYSITVHKSQGSEYGHVLFLIPDGSSAFGREVLYTAVTRAKNKLEIEGNPEEIEAILSKSSRKISGIAKRLN